MRNNQIIQFARRVAKTRLFRKDETYLAGTLARELPWKEILSYFDSQGISGLLRRHVKKLGLFRLLPSSAKKHLETWYLATAQNNLSAISEMRLLSDMASSENIPVLAIQGLTIVRNYEDPGLRPMGDLDLMVGLRDRQRFGHLLAKAGFRVSRTTPDMFCKNGLWIDIHTHVLNLDRIRTRRLVFPENMRGMWDRAGLFFETGSLMIPDPFDNYIALSAHALKHSYSRLIWLTDLYEWIRYLSKYPRFHLKLADSARFWCQEKPVWYSLVLLDSVLGAPGLSPVMDALGPMRPNFAERTALRLLAKGFSSNELCFALWLSMIDDNPGRIAFLRENMFPSKIVMGQMAGKDSDRIGMGAYMKRNAHIAALVMTNIGRLARYLSA